MQADPSEYADALEQMMRAVVKSEIQERDRSQRIKRLIPEWDGSLKARCNLAHELGKHFTTVKTEDWFSMPWNELLHYVDKAVEAKQNSPVEQYSPPMLKGDVARKLGIKTDALMDRVRRKELRVTDVQYRTLRVHIDDLPK